MGSCVSRDIYNQYPEGSYEIVEYYARSSLISAMSAPPSDAKIDLSDIKSPFQRRMVEFELSRQMKSSVGLLEFDYLLLDFIDERHDILEISPDSYVTLTTEFMDSGYMERNPLMKNKIVKCGSVRFKLLWLEALSKYMELADVFDFKRKLVLNRAMWATLMDTGEVIPGTSSIYTLYNNNLLEWMYHMIDPYLSEHQVISAPPSYILTTRNHRWGPAPFHFVAEYYDYFCIEIKNRLTFLKH